MTENLKNIDPTFIDELMGKFSSENKRLRFIICTTILNLIEERDTFRIDKKQIEQKMENMKQKNHGDIENIRKEANNNIENQRKVIKEKDKYINEIKLENKNLLKKIDSLTIDNIKLSSKVKVYEEFEKSNNISPNLNSKSQNISKKSPNTASKSPNNRSKSPISYSKKSPTYKSPLSSTKNKSLEKDKNNNSDSGSKYVLINQSAQNI